MAPESAPNAARGEHTRRLLSQTAAASLEERPSVPLKGKTRAVALYAPATIEIDARLVARSPVILTA